MSGATSVESMSTRIGEPLPFVGQTLLLVGQAFALVRQAFAFLGEVVAFVGVAVATGLRCSAIHDVPHIRRARAPAAPSRTRSRP